MTNNSQAVLFCFCFVVPLTENNELIRKKMKQKKMNIISYFRFVCFSLLMSINVMSPSFYC